MKMPPLDGPPMSMIECISASRVRLSPRLQAEQSPAPQAGVSAAPQAGLSPVPQAPLSTALQADAFSLWRAASASGNLCDRVIAGETALVRMSDLVHGSSLGGRVEELRGRSVLIATADQLTAALALIELDGVARSLVLWPADLPIDHLPYVISSVPVDTIVSDESAIGKDLGIALYLTSRATITSACTDRSMSAAVAHYRTEWILLTSGTTARPKMVVHTLTSLCSAIEIHNPFGNHPIWSTFYDIRRYGGLQIFLRAMLTGGSMVLSSARESVTEFLHRAGAHGVTQISGTPSHWRRALMSPAASKIAPQYVRLSGEIADQSILDHLHSLPAGPSCPRLRLHRSGSSV